MNLIALLDNPSFIKYFIVALTKQRTKGKFKCSESLVKDLAEILLKIIKMAETEKNYENGQNCTYLSQTYYYKEKKDDKKKKDNNNKIFLFEFIKDNTWLKSIEFWEGLISTIIENEITQNKEANVKHGNEENEIIKQNRLSNICFNQLLENGVKMSQFDIDRKEIENLIEKFSKKYEITRDLIQFIYDHTEMEQNEVIRSNSKNLEKNIEKKDIEKEEKKEN